MVQSLHPDLSVVVPTFNERERLPDLVRRVIRACAAEDVRAEVIVVDDNSPDGTGALAEDLARQLPIRVLHRPGKLGLGTAVVEGFETATAEVVSVIDADLSHPPELLPRMLAVMREMSADIVIGSRYIRGGGTTQWTWSRLALSRLACAMARLLTPVRDATSGFFLIHRDLARGVRIRAGGFKICLELLVRSRPSRVVEVPYVFHGRTVGESKMNLAEALGYLLQIKDLRRFIRTRPPLRQEYRQLRSEELTRARVRDQIPPSPPPPPPPGRVGAVPGAPGGRAPG